MEDRSGPLPPARGRFEIDARPGEPVRFGLELDGLGEAEAAFATDVVRDLAQERDWVDEFETELIQVTGNDPWPVSVMVVRWQRNAIGERRWIETREYQRPSE